tara:strand:- start:2003 stop:2269 length:267 start_codon:yes stop_codon:yes gene_type:complete
MQCAVEAALGEPAHTTIRSHVAGGLYVKTPLLCAACAMLLASHVPASSLDRALSEPALREPAACSTWWPLPIAAVVGADAMEEEELAA